MSKDYAQRLAEFKALERAVRQISRERGLDMPIMLPPIDTDKR